MAILWQKHQHGVLYQVRTAGKTRRLYADGVCHSQYHPERITTRSIWDLLLFPGFFLPAEKINKVLLLGLGGGALVHLLKHYVKPQQITAIELDPIHIYVAKRFFGVNRSGVELIESDAQNWLQQYRGDKFDMIVDDLFSHSGGIPQRAVKANTTWFDCLNQNLSESGLLVMNFADKSELNSSAIMTNTQMYNQYQSIYQFSNRLLDNRVVALSRKNLPKNEFRIRYNNFPEFVSKRSLNFVLRKLK